jgi:TonB family protein
MTLKSRAPAFSSLCLVVLAVRLSNATPMVAAFSGQAGKNEVTVPRLEAQNEETDAQNHFKRATTLDETNDVYGEIAELREAIRLKPDFAEAHLNLGLALFKERQMIEAIDEYRQAIRLKSDVPKAHLSLGVALAWRRDLDGAIAEYREAIRLKPDYGEAHRYLGYELMATGQHEEGLGELEVARKLEPPLTHADMRGLIVKEVQPKYPEKARQAHIQGQVVLQVVISENGTVDALTPVSGDPLLAHAAIDAVKQWRFKPYIVDGNPHRVNGKIEVNFKLAAGQ